MVLVNCDCLEYLKKMPNDSVDLLVTDPPYGYSFMNKDWDKAVPRLEIWKECLRVLKPGAFAFVMSAPRSDVQCEMILKLKEAGFEVGFTPIYWAYASGFPKASNISKMVDKRLGVEPEIIGKGISGKPETHSVMNMAYKEGSKSIMGGEYNITKPVSEEAKQLDGLFGGFQPKPAVEVVLVVMKPIEEKTFVEQALKNGHGGTWLGRCRIPYASENDKDIAMREGFLQDIRGGNYGIAKSERREDLGKLIIGNSDGRFPANLLVSDNVLDIESGGAFAPVKSGQKGFGGEIYGKYATSGDDGKTFYSNKESSKSFSRYFSLDAWWEKAVQELPEEQRKTFPFLIVPKASKSEKNKGLEKFGTKKVNDGRTILIDNAFQRGKTERFNSHPTVKPLKLMQYLVTLGCNKGELVLDPFMGSGTTCIASKLQGRRSIGIEMNKEYFEIAKARVSFYEQQKELEK